MEFTKKDFHSIHVGDGRIYAEYSGEGEESKLRHLKEYGVKDHKAYVGEGAPTLSTRLTFADRNGDRFIHLLPCGQERAEVNQLLDYYPFGLVHGGTTCRPEIENENAYRYNGKELIEGAGLYDYGARYYDPAIGRWNAVDSLADKFAHESPFAYVGNNPIGNIDVGGKYKLPAEFIARYPNISRYLQNNVRSDVMNSPAILSAFSRHSEGNLTPEAVDRAVTWGTGPEVRFSDAPGGNVTAYGYYSHVNTSLPQNQGKEGHIELRTSALDYLEGILGGDATQEEKLQALLPVYMTLLHETVHYGDYLDGRRQDGGEPGDAFEITVWGIQGEEEDGTTFSVARFFPDKYEDTQGLIDAINEFLANGQQEILPTVPE